MPERAGGRKHPQATLLRLEVRRRGETAAEARTAPESALRQAVAGLECVAGLPELRDTPVEEVTRTLLATCYAPDAA